MIETGVESEREGVERQGVESGSERIETEREGIERRGGEWKRKGVDRRSGE